MKNIILEFVEIVINQILYLRAIYPQQIFKKCKAYSLPVYCSIYPPLNSYVKNALIAAKHLIEENNLRRLELIIYKGSEDNILECFTMAFSSELKVSDSDRYLMELEEQFRKSIYSLEKRCKLLKKRTGEHSKFKVLLYTTESCYQELCNEPKFQDFLWIQEKNDKLINKSENSEVLPILMMETEHKDTLGGFHFYIEKFQ